MPDKTHVVLQGSRRVKDPEAKRIGPIDPNQRIDVTIDLAGPPLPKTDEYVGEKLTPAELAEKFGASKADADKVAKSLKKFGLKVEEVLLASRSMRVSGTIAQMEKAFKPELEIMHSVRQGDYRGRTGTLQIPAELSGIVKSVLGLDERQMARRELARGGAGSLAPLGPADLEKLYNFPAGDCAGQKIAIGELGGGYFAEDVNAFCNKYSRSVPNIQAVAVDAPAYTLAQILALPPKQKKLQLDYSGEVMMDVEIVAALCAKADVTVYFSTFDQQGWVDLLDKVIAAVPVVLSVSWGLAEDYAGWSQSARAAVDNRLNAARLLGITPCFSSGDDGSGDEMTDGRAHVDFPGSSPNTLCVGGTMLQASGKEVTWWNSPGWRTNNGGGSTGGGVSVFFPRPAWQNVKVKSLNAKSIDGRVVPDIAALAGNPFYDLIFRGKPSPAGGTSASTPLWASLIARVNALLPAAKQQRFLTPLLYQKGSGGKPVGASVTRDITVGDNPSNPDPGKGYKAGPGYDAVTGWGVPDGEKLLSVLPSIP